MEDITIVMPAIALRGMSIMPGMIAHFDISRDRSLKAVEESMQADQKIFLVTQRDVDVEEPMQSDLYEMGIVAEIKQVVKLQNDVVRILIDGKSRAKLVGFTRCEDFLEAEICTYNTDLEGVPSDVREAMLVGVRESFEKYATVVGKVNKELFRQIEKYDDIEKLIDFVTNNLPVSYAQKQKVLGTEDICDRYEVIVAILLKQINVAQIKNDFQQKVKKKIDKHQREYLLREQMSVIREELGENADSEADDFLKKTESLNAPEEVRQKLKKEIERYRNLSGSSSESVVARGYIETLLELPWNDMSTDNTDLDRAEKILNDDHYGLSDVKERVLEFLSVRNLTNKGESPIICLVGPPGTGKTSIARSIAAALEKKYVRICLGGVRDEAEIRGHRKTYVGAMPGRIINALKTAGTANPLILLDEIDKVSSDYKGDTSAALLEVLDSEQNSRFRDHYVELPVDLSEVLFIATANSVSDIPKPLLDRMELIEVSSYTENEKFHIAKEHLVEKQKEKNGLKKDQLTITDSALRDVIRYYTREAGVRGLERTIGKICRKAARQIYQKNEESIKIKKNNIKDYLGNVKYMPEKRSDKADIGIVRGLAWTSVGGVTLEVEVNVLPGKGELALTGKMGDVMKESAQAGLSYIRSISDKYDIKPEFYKEHDIHIHIPEGAVPKDGPSAGITMATAMLSAITKKPVRADIAMTGELTLRGRVLPIGGLKEKLLAAKNIGIKTVCIPKDNEKDLEEISNEITDGMEIIPVDRFEQVEKQAFAV